MIPEGFYEQIIEVLPILCVDIVITNPQNEYLVVKRKNEPLKGKWWVVGGRVLKGETLSLAAIRKVREEIGLKIDPPELMGFFEAPKQANPFGGNNKYHAVSIVYKTQIAADEIIELDSQSSDWQFHKNLPEQFGVQRF